MVVFVLSIRKDFETLSMSSFQLCASSKWKMVAPTLPREDGTVKDLRGKEEMRLDSRKSQRAAKDLRQTSKHYEYQGRLP